MRLLTCVLLIGSVLRASAGPQPPLTSEPVLVAVMDFAGPEDRIREAITETFTTDLAHSERVRLVERARLREILQELKLQGSGLVDAEQAARIGRQLGARKIVIGSFTTAGTRVALSARLVDVETGQVEVGGAAQVEGAIEGEDADTYGLAHQLATRFHRAITGEWLPDVAPGDPAKTRAQDLLAALAETDSGLKLDLKLDRRPGSTYHWGERLRVAFRVNRPAYVTLLNIDTTRRVSRLYPNQWHPEQKATPGRWHWVPGEGEDWELKIEGELGEEEIIAIATTQPLRDERSKGIPVASKSAAQLLGKTVVPRLLSQPGARAVQRIRFFTARRER